MNIIQAKLLENVRNLASVRNLGILQYDRPPIYRRERIESRAPARPDFNEKIQQVFEFGGVKPVISCLLHRLGANQ